MLPLILWAIACIIEARMDTWVERYKLDLIGRQGRDIDTGKYWAYNPLRPYKIGFLRDGWHFMKLVYLGLIVAAIVVPTDLKWYCVVGSCIIIRAVVFPVALKVFR